MVDFPEPDNPIMTKVSPRLISKETFLSATVTPVFFVYLLY